MTNCNHIIAKHLTKLNNNIDWNELINRSKDKLIYNICKALWIDKSIESEGRNTKYFRYYLKLFNEQPLTNVAILNFKDCSYDVNSLLKFKIEISKSILTMMRIDVEIIDEITNDYDYLLPIGSITHHNINEQLKNYNGKIIRDDELYNFTIVSPTVNDVLIKAKLSMTRTDELEELINTKFYFIDEH